VLCDRPHAIQVIGQEAVDVVGGEFEFLLAELDTGKREQIGGETGEALGILADDIQKPEIVGGIVDGAVQQRFGVALDGGERRAQLVRDVDDEILADILQFFELGVLGFQAVEHELEFFTGFVELGGEQAQLAAGGAGEARAEVTFGELAGEFDDGSQAAGDVAGENRRQNHERQEGQGGGKQHVIANGADLRLDSGCRDSQAGKSLMDALGDEVIDRDEREGENRQHAQDELSEDARGQDSLWHWQAPGVRKPRRNEHISNRI
jgi:hypothetical protein